MPIPTRTDLKSLFQTGDKPTEADFAELIDAIYDLFQQAQDTADAAVATAEAGNKVKMSLTLDVTAALTIYSQYNVASVVQTAVATGYRTVRVTFTNPLPDANYVVLFYPLGKPTVTVSGSASLTAPIAAATPYSTDFDIVVSDKTAADFKIQFRVNAQINPLAMAIIGA